MAIINGTGNNDTLQGTAENDQITAGDGQDVVSGEGADDLIDGGADNDLLFGDAGEGTAPGFDASPITLDYGNRVNNTGNFADVGDNVVYRDVAQLEDGTPVWGRLVLVGTSNNAMPIDLTGGNGFEILLNNGGGAAFTGETARFRLEFFNPLTGDPVALNSTATFNDLDRNSPGDQESITVDADNFTAFATSDDTSLDVTQTGGVINAAGTEDNSPVEQDAWFSLEARSSPSGFTLSGDLIDDPVVTPIEAGDDTILGGDGQDTIFGQGGDDSLLGELGDDSIEGGQGADTLLGGQGEDTLLGGAGDDSLVGGAGNDQMSAGDGMDSLVSGLGNDQSEGGFGDDTFTFDASGSHTIIGGEDVDGLDIDRIDMTGVDRSTYRIIEGAPEAGRIEFLDGNGDVIGQTDYTEIEEVIICFTPGTLIATKRGEIRVQQLKVGDMVLTRDNGVQPLRWVGRRNLHRDDLARMPSYQPILITAGALGRNMPQQDMLVSPNHRMLVTSELAEVMFGEREVLVAAKHLTGLDGVDPAPHSKVSYIHIMFDNHEIVLADGCWAESFQPGDHSMAGIKSEQRQEIIALFPELESAQGLKNYTAARRFLRAHEAHLLSLRH